jgi:hypothetical protein
MDDHVLLKYGPMRRISKACEECRRRKIKCDWETPCSHCLQRGTECLVRIVARQRIKKKKSYRRSPGEIVDTTYLAFKLTRAAYLNCSPDTTDQLNIRTSHNSFAVNETASWPCEIPPGHGTKPSFPSIQHIHRQFASRISHLPMPRGDASTALSLGSFPHLFVGNWYWLGSTPNELASMFIPYSITSQFLDRYFQTYHHLAPFLTKDDYQYELSLRYCGLDNTCLEGPKATLLMLVLAIGARTTDCGDIAELIFQKATAIHEVNSLSAVQISLLKISGFYLMLKFPRS